MFHWRNENNDEFVCDAAVSSEKEGEDSDSDNYKS